MASLRVSSASFRAACSKSSHNIEAVLSTVLKRRKSASAFRSPSSLAVPKTSLRSEAPTGNYSAMQRRHEALTLETVMLSRMKEAYTDRDVPPTHLRLIEMIERGALPKSLVTAAFGEDIPTAELRELLSRRTASAAGTDEFESGPIPPSTTRTLSAAPSPPPPHPALVRTEPLDDMCSTSSPDPLSPDLGAALGPSTSYASSWAIPPLTHAATARSFLAMDGRPGTAGSGLSGLGSPRSSAAMGLTSFSPPSPPGSPPLAAAAVPHLRPPSAHSRQRFDFDPATLRRTYEATFLRPVARRPPTNPPPTPPKWTPGHGLLHDVRAMTGRNPIAVELEREREAVVLAERGVCGTTERAFSARSARPLPPPPPLRPPAISRPRPSTGYGRPPPATDERLAARIARAAEETAKAQETRALLDDDPTNEAVHPRAASAGVARGPDADDDLNGGGDSSRGRFSNTTGGEDAPATTRRSRPTLLLDDRARTRTQVLLSPADVMARFKSTVIMEEAQRRAQQVASYGGLGALDTLHMRHEQLAAAQAAAPPFASASSAAFLTAGTPLAVGERSPGARRLPSATPPRCAFASSLNGVTLPKAPSSARTARAVPMLAMRSVSVVGDAGPARPATTSGGVRLGGAIPAGAAGAATSGRPVTAPFHGRPALASSRSDVSLGAVGGGGGGGDDSTGETGREYLRQQSHMREAVHGVTFGEAPTVLTPLLRNMSGALADMLSARVLEENPLPPPPPPPPPPGTTRRPARPGSAQHSAHGTSPRVGMTARAATAR